MIKNKKKDVDIAIIGIGSFGQNVLRNFSEEGLDVTIIDSNQDIINKYSNLCSSAFVADSTNANALKKMGINNYDHVIVAIGQDINASILTTLLLLEFGIENITVKASDENHVKILNKIGAHNIIFPDKEMGKRVAKQVMYRSLKELVELNEIQVMAEISVSDKNFIGHNLADLDITNNFGVIIAAIRRNDLIIVPTATEQLQADDLLIVIGETANVEKLTKSI